MFHATEIRADPAMGAARRDWSPIPAEGGALDGVLAPRGVEVRPQRMLRMMGYRDERPASPAVRRIAEAMAEVAAVAIVPRVYFRSFPIAACDDERLVLSTGATFRSPAFRKFLSDCSSAVVFVLTLGSRLDSTERNLAAGGNLLESVFLETAGWLAVEETTRLFAAHLAAEAGRHGLEPSRRLAPGYSFRLDGRKVEWRLEDQKELFALFADAALPVELLDTCAMRPKMSRTGLFGLRPVQSPAPA
jgi:hypothetical protein